MGTLLRSTAGFFTRSAWPLHCVSRQC